MSSVTPAVKIGLILTAVIFFAVASYSLGEYGRSNRIKALAKENNCEIWISRETSKFNEILIDTNIDADLYEFIVCKDGRVGLVFQGRRKTTIRYFKSKTAEN